MVCYKKQSIMPVSCTTLFPKNINMRKIQCKFQGVPPKVNFEGKSVMLNLYPPCASNFLDSVKENENSIK